MIQHQPPDSHKKRKKKNWGNIYRGALPLPGDLLEKEQMKHGGKTSSGRISERIISHEIWTGMRLKQNFEMKSSGGGCWQSEKWVQICVGSAVDVDLLSHVRTQLRPSRRHLSLIHFMKISKKSKVCQIIQRRRAELHT